MREAWYVVQTRPQMERVARDGLKRAEFLTFLPMVRFKDWPVPRPLYSRYLFVRLNAGNDAYGDLPWFGRIRNIHGVYRLLGGEEPAPVFDEFVEKLDKRLGLSNGILELNTKSDFREFLEGQHVKIISSNDSLYGREGICTWVCGNDLVIDLMNNLVTRQPLVNRIRLKNTEVIPINITEDPAILTKTLDTIRRM